MEHNFKKKFGQNFLSDKNLLSAIVQDAGVTSKDNVLEIGAGAGALTACLDAAAKKVVAYEIDKDLMPQLQSLGLKKTQFVFEDALKQKIEDVEAHFDRQKYKVVANLPYYITTPLLFKFLQESQRVESLTVMVQKEVAQRIVAQPGGKDYGALTVMIAFFGSAKITRIVSRTMFYPQPNVDSAVVQIERKNNFEGIDRTAFHEFVKICFAARRKTLANNLSKGTGKSKSQLEKMLSQEVLSKRAEDLSPQQLVDLFVALRKA